MGRRSTHIIDVPLISRVSDAWSDVAEKGGMGWMTGLLRRTTGNGVPIARC